MKNPVVTGMALVVQVRPNQAPRSRNCPEAAPNTRDNEQMEKLSGHCCDGTGCEAPRSRNCPKAAPETVDMDK